MQHIMAFVSSLFSMMMNDDDDDDYNDEDDDENPHPKPNVRIPIDN